ncbi:putative flavoprotein CzcO associated with the cation diffusion facilitator CzcD [Nocardia amikacinitolerans]|uniref:flavin-containing monooxygenase n=1 Tax=Nocardia amikacinitolerans TaxID=756689 RepID=UPI000832D67F|nr:NAD(P)/FAD-dependent oxidoreductase [Nocardia amikacinitolerans]MCP2314955.1 putative flavoprotein CzcO associated with the cation diffusion facilitator CzcD [Nocardia amikacinitolerans]
MTATQHGRYEVVVIGAGFAGLCAAIKLRQAGIHDFVVVDKADDVGGVWRDNTYPDVGVDVPTWGYSFSFEPNPDWAHVYAKGHEMKAYADHCVEKYGVRAHLRLGTEVLAAAFDEDAHLWRLETGRGVLRSRYLVVAYGGLGRPKVPAIDGLDTFAGPVIHSARWDHGYSPEGRRIGLIGTGSSAVQIIPELADRAERLVIFQRTPIWVIPKPDFRIPMFVRRAFRAAPWLLRPVRWAVLVWLELIYTCVFRFKLPAFMTLLQGMSILTMRWQIRDRALREKLTPHYGFGCKFLTLSNRYYRSFARDHVELVSDDIVAMTENGITTADGRHHEIDSLILATGFEVLERANQPKFPITGVGGADLGRFLDTNPKGHYEGVTLPGWPNCFTVLGLYAQTGTFFGSVEDSVDHAIRCITEARGRGATRVAVRTEPYDRYVREMIERQQSSVFYHSNCEGVHTWYFDARGDTPLFRPTSSAEARRRVRRVSLDHYDFTSVAEGDRDDREREAS